QLGYLPADLAGQSVLGVFLEEDREFVRNSVAVCLETIGQSHTWEIRKIRKDGSLLWVRENAKALRRPDDQLIVLIACEDITERTHPDDRAAVQKTVDQASRDGKDFEHEYRLLTPNGSVKHLHALARATIDASGGLEFVGAVTDVTVAKEAEQRLRRSESYLAE